MEIYGKNMANKILVGNIGNNIENILPMPKNGGSSV
eukprot:CAMPEP_0179922098 /NCGR_PEP_ID=MMETSP0983-20121128/5436_1 /TAXON_ID=483367 /ORGANISM="non described non described, Strain CCMP 2436" /LENGTH=35 /DNA_ID= /DNA_START= /DNA_END= /DNA_ORIENTATION=